MPTPPLRDPSSGGWAGAGEPRTNSSNRNRVEPFQLFIGQMDSFPASFSYENKEGGSRSKMGEEGERGEKRSQAPHSYPSPAPETPELLMGGRERQNALCQAGTRGVIQVFYEQRARSKENCCRKGG